MTRPGTGKRAFIFLFATLLAALGLALTFLPACHPTTLLAGRLEAQLPSLPDAEIPHHLHLFSQLGCPGTDVLVRLLGHQRPLVAASAGTALHNQLDEWMDLPARQSTPMLAHLASQLAHGFDGWKPASQDVARDLSSRMLRWPLDRSTDAGMDVVANCQHIAELAPSHRPQPHAPLASPTGITGDASSQEPSDGNAQRVADLRTDGLRAKGSLSDDAPIPPINESQSAVETTLEDTAESIHEPGLISLPLREQPRILFPPDPAPIAPSDAHPRRIEDHSNMAPTDSTFGLAPAAATLPGRRIDQLSDFELVCGLRDANAGESHTIKQLLKLRGFTPTELDLATRLNDPDPRRRQKLAESLSTYSNSPSRWLYWLSFDPHPLVRQQTVGLMATSQDPLLHRRLREMEIMETDEGVRSALGGLQSAQRGSRR